MPEEEEEEEKVEEVTDVQLGKASRNRLTCLRNITIFLDRLPRFVDRDEIRICSREH